MHQEKPNLIVPKAIWEPIFFGSTDDRQTIRGRTSISKLPDLRETVLPAGDIEVRLWDGFGLTLLQGFVLKRTAGRWMAILLLPAVPRYAGQDYKKALPVPRSGWERFWNGLVREGLLTLPDSSTLKGERRYFDGTSYVVEINHDKTYRTYMYGNPDEQKWPQAKRIVKIIRTVYQEFGLHG